MLNEYLIDQLNAYGRNASMHSAVDANVIVDAIDGAWRRWMGLRKLAEDDFIKFRDAAKYCKELKDSGGGATSSGGAGGGCDLREFSGILSAFEVSKARASEAQVSYAAQVANGLSKLKGVAETDAFGEEVGLEQGLTTNAKEMTAGEAKKVAEADAAAEATDEMDADGGDEGALAPPPPRGSPVPTLPPALDEQ